MFIITTTPYAAAAAAPGDAITLEAPDDEVHDTLLEGLELLLADARRRGSDVFVPLSEGLSGRLLADAFSHWWGLGQQ